MYLKYTLHAPGDVSRLPVERIILHLYGAAWVRVQIDPAGRKRWPQGREGSRGDLVECEDNRQVLTTLTTADAKWRCYQVPGVGLQMVLWCNPENSRSCRIDVGPASATLAQHQPDMISAPRVCWDVTELCLNKGSLFVHHYRHQPSVDPWLATFYIIRSDDISRHLLSVCVEL